MLHIEVQTDHTTSRLAHDAGPLEFGRGEGGAQPRCVVDDPHVSRAHLLIEERSPGRLFVENLSRTSDVELIPGPRLGLGASDEVALPVQIRIGASEIQIRGDAPPQPDGLETVTPPAVLDETHSVRRTELGPAPDIETLIRWFETLILVEQAAATSQEFFGATAEAVVDLVGLDRGLVLVAEGGGSGQWKIVASHAEGNEATGPRFSRSIVEEVVRRRRTFFRNLRPEDLTESLMRIEAVVAAPVLDSAQNVVGIVYGSRDLRPSRDAPDITPLEARLVQVLAAAVGAGLAREKSREHATRAQLQFEQFFSRSLATELTRDPSLLDGRKREITILFSDVRSFSRISERLGPVRTFSLMQEVMELQSAEIRRQDGVVVDYVGDGLLAMWNAPTDQADHAERAARAAIAIQEELPSLSAKWQDVAGSPLRIGIGLNTGTALVGNTGSLHKFKYGPIGPTVNIASRTEDATKFLGVPIVITGTTAARLPPGLAVRRLGRARLAGIGEAVELFELHTGGASPTWTQLAEAFEAALANYEAGRWAESCSCLAPLLAVGGPQFDIPSLQLMSRAVECLKTRPEPFDPIVDIG